MPSEAAMLTWIFFINVVVLVFLVAAVLLLLRSPSSSFVPSAVTDAEGFVPLTYPPGVFVAPQPHSQREASDEADDDDFEEIDDPNDNNMITIIGSARARPSANVESLAASESSMPPPRSTTIGTGSAGGRFGQLRLVEYPFSVFAIAEPQTRIGRHPDNHVVIADLSVHRNHALISIVDGGRREIRYLFADSEDGNGMFINSTRRVRAELSDGDEIRLGATRLCYGAEPTQSHTSDVFETKTEAGRALDSASTHHDPATSLGAEEVT